MQTGLIPNQQTPEQGMSQPGNMPMMDKEQNEQEEGQGNVTPEEQASYDKFVDNAFKLIYSDKTFQQTIKSLSASEDPIANLAGAAVTIVTHLKESAEKANAPISNDILMHGGVEIIEDLADTAEKAGIHSYTDQELEGATYRAFDMYREHQEIQGKTDKDAAMKDIEQMKQAEANGQLGAMFPGAKEGYESRFGKGAQSGPQESEGETQQKEQSEKPVKKGY